MRAEEIGQSVLSLIRKRSVGEIPCFDRPKESVLESAKAGFLRKIAVSGGGL